MIVVFDKSTGNFVLRLPDDVPDPYQLAKKWCPDLGLEQEYAFVSVSDKQAAAASEDFEPAERGKARLGMLYKYEDGAVIVAPEFAQAISDRKARKAAIKAGKQAAKAAKKLDAFESMSAQDFDALTAAKKWDIVFAFMKTHMSED